MLDISPITFPILDLESRDRLTPQRGEAHVVCEEPSTLSAKKTRGARYVLTGMPLHPHAIGLLLFLGGPGITRDIYQVNESATPAPATHYIMNRPMRACQHQPGQISTAFRTYRMNGSYRRTRVDR